MISQNTVRGLLSDLVSIDSVNPDLVSGGAGEAKIAAYIASWLQKAGANVEIDEPRPGRVSVIARAPGSGGGRSLLLNGHIDTVGVSGMTNPHNPRIESNKLFGRGAYDMKAGVAAAMLTLAAAVELPRRGEVILTAVCDEEYASIGTESVLKRMSADAAIVTEPTALDIVVAHKGFAWFDVETMGIAAHGSRPDLGVDAIMSMGKVLTRLELLNRSLTQGAPHALLGNASLHASLISGGQELSSYPERCRLSIERRSIPGETAAQMAAEIQGVLDELSATDPKLKAALTVGFAREPFQVSEEEAIVTLLRRTAAAKLDRIPAVIGMNAWMDAALLSTAGIPTVVFGPGGGGAHAVEEWSNLDELLVCHEVLLATVAAFCA